MVGEEEKIEAMAAATEVMGTAGLEHAVAMIKIAMKEVPAHIPPSERARYAAHILAIAAGAIIGETVIEEPTIGRLMTFIKSADLLMVSARENVNWVGIASIPVASLWGAVIHGYKFVVEESLDDLQTLADLEVAHVRPN